VDEVLFRLSQCLAAAGRYAEARPHIGRLQSEFPKSPFLESARKLEASFPPAGVPAAPPASPTKPAGPPPEAPAKKPGESKPPGLP
jgi:hypothetical protein